MGYIPTDDGKIIEFRKAKQEQLLRNQFEHDRKLAWVVGGMCAFLISVVIISLAIAFMGA